jgi:hypothetical protein
MIRAFALRHKHQKAEYNGKRQENGKGKFFGIFLMYLL